MNWLVILVISFFIGANRLLFAQSPSFNDAQKREAAPIEEKQKENKQIEDLSALQTQARVYRSQGLELQRAGDLSGAITFYQKAVELDSGYAVAYNDLGIIYEAQGSIDRAEYNYLRAIEIDPNFLSAYSNLALLYENKLDFQNAAFYWSKRAELGSSNDPWVMKAKLRLEDLGVYLPKKETLEAVQPDKKEIDKFTEEVSQQQRAEKIEKKKAPVKAYKISSPKEGQPQRINDKEKEQISIEAAKAHYNLGTLFFKSGKYQEAANEFKRVILLMPEDPSVYYNLGVIYDDYLEDGNPQAIKYYRKYVQLAPNASDLNSVKEKILQAETEERLRIGGLLDREPPKEQTHH